MVIARKCFMVVFVIQVLMFYHEIKGGSSYAFFPYYVLIVSNNI